METINRVTGMLVNPKKEWLTIDTENTSHIKVLTTYVLLLALIPAVAIFIGYALIGTSVFGVHFTSAVMGFRHAIIQYVSMVGGVYISALVINMLAGNFGAQKDFNRAFALVAYAYTPMFVGGVFYLLPILSWVSLLAGIYGLYLLYIGLQPMMKAPADKQMTYFIISLVVMIVVALLLSVLLNTILLDETMSALSGGLSL